MSIFDQPVYSKKWLKDLAAMDAAKAAKCTDAQLKNIISTFRSSAPDSANGRWVAACEAEVAKRAQS